MDIRLVKIVKIETCSFGKILLPVYFHMDMIKIRVTPVFHIILYNTYKDTNTNIKTKYELYHGVRLVVKSREEFTVIEHTRKQQQQQQQRQ